MTMMGWGDKNESAVQAFRGKKGRAQKRMSEAKCGRDAPILLERFVSDRRAPEFWRVFIWWRKICN